MYNQAHSQSKCKTCLRRSSCRVTADYESAFYAMNRVVIYTSLFSTELHCDAYQSNMEIPNKETERTLGLPILQR